jgi:hypothetical protein
MLQLTNNNIAKSMENGKCIVIVVASSMGVSPFAWTRWGGLYSHHAGGDGARAVVDDRYQISDCTALIVWTHQLRVHPFCVSRS